VPSHNGRERNETKGGDTPATTGVGKSRVAELDEMRRSDVERPIFRLPVGCLKVPEMIEALKK
jgi:hypothetical protein